MLKAKKTTNLSARKAQAMKEVMKDDNQKGIFVRVSAKQFKKLHVHLAKEDMNLADWVKEKINDI